MRDRVAERAILAVMTPIVDPWLGPFSYAYRPGLGVADAVQALARLRDEGLGWVARADLHDCFSHIPVGHLRRLIGALVDDVGVLALVDALLARRASGRGALSRVPGIAQGSPLSPLWSNLVLAGFDDQVTAAGYPLVRHGDDIAVATADRDEAWEAMRVVHEAAQALGMPLGADKAEVLSFADGFTFLGEDFGPRYPPVLDGHRMAGPVRRALYLALQGSRVRLDNGRLVVESPQDQELLDVPSSEVERRCVSARSG